MVENNNAVLATAPAAARVFAHVLLGCVIIAAFVPSRLLAAEVDAIGAPAPIGFADVIERVKPAVVGVRVKVAEPMCDLLPVCRGSATGCWQWAIRSDWAAR
jgi:serine protease Do